MLLFNVPSTATVLIGVVSLYLGLVVLSWLSAQLLIPESLLVPTLGYGAEFIDEMELAWLVGSLATIAGALGGGLETDTAVREPAYASRGGTEQPH